MFDKVYSSCLSSSFISKCHWLTLSWRRSLSYRNQSIDIQSTPIDWFLYDRDLRHERVKTHKNMEFYPISIFHIKSLCEKTMSNYFSVSPCFYTKYLNISTINIFVVSKGESWENLYHQSVKLGNQSKLYEQNYSQMIPAI